MFIRTTAINKLLALTNRKKVIQGGTWAGKTYGILPIIINQCANSGGLEYTIVAESVPALKKGVIKDFKKIMMETNRWIEDNYNATDKKYTFTKGSYIEFSSFATVGDAEAAGKRTGLFINEAPYINFDIADALMMRTTGDIWLDFNPHQRFWAHEHLVDTKEADFLILTYRDNEGLPETILEELQIKKGKAFYNIGLPVEQLYKESNIKDKHWANWCKVYLDGLIGSLEGVIFQEGVQWDIVKEAPKDSTLLGFGMDFGFTNDPTTWLSGSKCNNSIYFDQLIYQTGLFNKGIAKLVKQSGANYGKPTIADQSDPKSIAEILQYGISIRKYKWTKDSIDFGIGLLQENKFYVTENSTDTIKELRKYSWKIDKSGKTTNEPIAINNHSIDAMRYFATEFMKQRVKHKSF